MHRFRVEMPDDRPDLAKIYVDDKPVNVTGYHVFHRADGFPVVYLEMHNIPTMRIDGAKIGFDRDTLKLIAEFVTDEQLRDIIKLHDAFRAEAKDDY